MKVKIENLPSSKIKINISLSSEEFSPYLVMAAEELSKKIEIAGFRPGKAPRNLVEEKIGKEKILEEAVNIFLNKIFPKIVEEKKLKILGQPQAKVDFPKVQNTGEFFAEIETTILPEVKLPNFKEIAKGEKRKEIKVKDKEIDEAFLWLQKSRAKLSRKLGPALKGDQVEVDYEIRSKGVKIENGEIKNQKIILGEEKLLPEFEKNLVGAKEGDEKKFSLKCPAEFWKKDLQGKMLDFKVKVNSVFKIEIPEANDEFAKSVGNFKDIKALKENIQKGIETEKKEIEKRRWHEAVINKIAKEAEVDVPDILIKEEKDQMLNDFKKTVEEQIGIPFEEHLHNLKKTKEDIEKELFWEAEKKVKIFLCIYEIAKKEKIEVSDEEINAEIEQINQRYPQIINEVQKSQGEEKFKNFIREKILEKKVMNLLDKIRDKG